jgi:hypothetical protein
VLDFLSCPLGEEDKARPHSPAGDSSWILRGIQSLLHLHSATLRRVVVSRDVRFEEYRSFVRSLESRVGVEDDAKLQIAVSEGAQPQISSTPVSGVTGSPCIASGSQSEHVQSDRAQTSEGA